MTNLSPAAQAVLNAANGRSSYGPDDCLNESRWIAAAALRAAADQVVPASDRPDPNIEFEYGQWLAQHTTRGHLLAIAAELRAHQ